MPDVAPYEHMKIRILNGGHAAIAYPAALLDIHFVHEAMEDETVRAFLAKLEHDEIIPVIPPVPNTDLSAYFKPIEKRLFNPKIGDTIPRLAQDGSNRQPKFILPTTADRLRRGEDVDRACRSSRRSGAATSPAPPIAARRSTSTMPAPTGCMPRRVKAKDDPTGLPCAFGYLRRSCAIDLVPQAVCTCAENTLGKGHAGNASALSRRKTSENDVDDAQDDYA